MKCGLLTKLLMAFILCTACIAILAFLALFGNPLKVTDPADPCFNPERFSFWDYPMGGGDKREVFAALFPVGTPKSYVDHVLIDVGGANSWRKEKDINLYGYWEPHRIVHLKGPPQHTFLFDEEGKVLQINPGSGSKLYPDQPDYKEYWNSIRKKR